MAHIDHHQAVIETAYGPFAVTFQLTTAHVTSYEANLEDRDLHDKRGVVKIRGVPYRISFLPHLQEDGKTFGFRSIDSESKEWQAKRDAVRIYKGDNMSSEPTNFAREFAETKIFTAVCEEIAKPQYEVQRLHGILRERKQIYENSGLDLLKKQRELYDAQVKHNLAGDNLALAEKALQ